MDQVRLSSQLGTEGTWKWCWVVCIRWCVRERGKILHNDLISYLKEDDQVSELRMKRRSYQLPLNAAANPLEG